MSFLILARVDPLVLWSTVVFLGVVGLVIGSFLNVVAWRLPRGASLSAEPSACPNCGHRIRWYDNVPLLSWLALRGRCRDCSEPISPRYPLVELTTGLLFAGIALWVLTHFRANGALAELAVLLMALAFLYLAAVSIVLAVIDIDTHTLPNRIVLPAYIVAGVFFVAAALLTGSWDALLRSAIGMAALFVFYLILAIAKPGGMGLGDVKLAGVLGIYLGWLGWGTILIGAFAAFVLGGIFSILLLVLRRASRKSGIPFGPWMLLGAWVGIFSGEYVWQWYLSLVGLSA